MIQRAKPKHLESKLQQNCVKWFDLQYRKLKPLLFAIPNGGRRGKLEASIMKGEGVRAGAADMMLAVPKFIKGELLQEHFRGSGHQQWWREDENIHGLFLEFKYGKGKQTDTQKEFEKAVTEQGYRYEVISDFDSFKNLVEEYLGK